MGAWGFKVENNDTAQDFLLDYNDLIKNGKAPYDAVEELFRIEWYGDDNEAILMAGKLEYENYGKIMHLTKVNKALEEELREQELSNWTDPVARKQELLDFMKRSELWRK